MIQNMKKWTNEFVVAYREEAFRLSDEEVEAFGEYSKEQLLSGPCQVEVLLFDNPYRQVLLFLFDKTKKDLQITLTKLNWKSINIFIVCLLSKYSHLKFDPNQMSKILSNIKDTAPDQMSYSIDFFKDACCIYFTHDVRIEALPMMQRGSSPESVAKTIFHLNHSQVQDMS
jgi:hypothetical protein